MKTLLKISLCFVLCLFVSASVSASDGPLEDSKTGTVTVTVVKSLAIEVLTPNAEFIYDEHGTTTTPVTTSKNSTVKVSATCDWNFTVNADEAVIADVDGLRDPIALSYISYELTGGEGAGAAKTALTQNGADYAGMTNDEFTVKWTADFTGIGNIYAGKYQVGVTYAVVEM